MGHDAINNIGYNPYLTINPQNQLGLGINTFQPLGSQLDSYNPMMRVPTYDTFARQNHTVQVKDSGVDLEEKLVKGGLITAAVIAIGAIISKGRINPTKWKLGNTMRTIVKPFVSLGKWIGKKLSPTTGKKGFVRRSASNMWDNWIPWKDASANLKYKQKVKDLLNMK